MICNKNTILDFLLDWRIWSLIIIGTYLLFSVSKLNKSMSHIVCNNSSCQVKDYNSRGTLEHFSEFPISQCKSFGIEEQNQTFLNLVDRISYNDNHRSSYHRYKDKYFKYTITCKHKNGHTYPIFKTAINNREKAQDFADTLGYELSKKNPTVDMKFKEK